MDKAELRIVLQDDGASDTGDTQELPRTKRQATGNQFGEPGWAQEPWRDWKKDPPPVRMAGQLAEAGGGVAEGAEAAGVGGLAAVLGPLAAVAGALIAVDLGANMVATGFRNMGDLVAKEADSVAYLISNDNMGALIKQANAAAETLGHIPIVGQVFEEAIKAATKALGAIGSVADSIIGRGQQLAPFSGELMAAGVRSEIKSMMADIREAQVLGPGMAHVTDIWTEIQLELREFLIPMKKFMIEGFGRFLEWIKEMFEKHQVELIAARETLESILEAVADVASGKPFEAMAVFQKLPERIAKAIRDAQTPQEIQDNPIFQEFMNLGRSKFDLPKFGVPPDPNIVFNQQLAIPAFQ